MHPVAVCQWLALHWVVLYTTAEFSSKSDPDYEFGDYRGKWCVDHHGFVYNIGEVYYPGPAACPCTCTEDGPVCVQPKCPRIHPRCTRISYKSCCPVCEAVNRVCVYRGRTYHLFEEFKLARCERCRCEPNGEVYCSISDCPALHCVNPTYEPKHCCPVCKNGPNCFAGNRIIAAGERVEVDEWTVCFCTYRDGTWLTHPHATCEARQRPDDDLSKQMEELEREKERERERERERARERESERQRERERERRLPRLDAIP
ncbi:von Willebrand factor C domain-containing protein 2-like [Trichomycterus rosablanca]|uniref:von Willebrand factor C domain-containing protein 2-like n=1 Tax=Trichomycterus rosablanca TaxID=2290929 RepID=UPI002F355109